MRERDTSGERGRQMERVTDRKKGRWEDTQRDSLMDRRKD